MRSLQDVVLKEVHFTVPGIVLFEAKSRHSRFCQIISAWLCESVHVCLRSWEVLLSTLWSELQLTEKARTTARYSALRGVIRSLAAYSCIFIFSLCLSSIHYCQLIRCKADRKTCPKFIKNSSNDLGWQGYQNSVGRQTGGGWSAGKRCEREGGF